MRAKNLDPQGGTIGSFPTDGPAPRGDVTVEKGADLKQAMQLLAEEVEKEPLPVEYKEQIRRFHGLLLGEETEE